ncbi:class I SAM-dependent methyltransferase [Allorhizocola rhizosphaerae]|uniref:class I SAM-dependent methyltransferase n=1 Tax=Allorhizocola rhizosphaerae TaxID=1872709 RepID=UPI000E3DDDDF|nr:class I SAM-dependent methyltransferase [Allorhizocola rhizosphaerae]
MSTTAVWSEEDSASFIRFAEHFVPDRAEQAAVVTAMVDPGRGTVLDLCCGAGGLSRRLLLDHPDCRVVGLDASDAMLAEASRQLASFGDRFRAERFDLGSPEWRRRGTAPAAVVSSLAVHHLTGDEKQALYRDMHELLAPGGSIVIADLVQPVGDRALELARRMWDEWVRAQGDEAHRAFHALEWSCFEYPDELDKPSPLRDQLQWLTEAGFGDVDAYWMKAGHAIFGGTKHA